MLPAAVGVSNTVAVPTFGSTRLGRWALPAERSAVMGILNITPDSFSDGGRHLSPEACLVKARGLLEDGADLLDIGAESTRPGAHEVTGEVQLERLAPIFEIISELGVPLSIDTRNADVAQACLKAGFEIVNDTSCGRHDAAMAPLVAEHGCVYIGMHARGTPQTMEQFNVYQNLVGEIEHEWREQIAAFLVAGCSPEVLWFDPGFGFAKDAASCASLLAELAGDWPVTNPLVVGLSRKRFLQYDGNTADSRDIASHVAIALIAANKRAVFRVHDVAGARQALHVVGMLSAAGRA